MERSYKARASKDQAVAQTLAISSFSSRASEPTAHRKAHDQKWACERCTFINDGGPSCGVCGFKSKRKESSSRSRTSSDDSRTIRPRGTSSRVSREAAGDDESCTLSSCIPPSSSVAPPTPSTIAFNHPPTVGARVAVRFDGGVWYGGSVERLGDGPILDIAYDDGTTETASFPDPDLVVLGPPRDEKADSGTARRQRTRPAEQGVMGLSLGAHKIPRCRLAVSAGGKSARKAENASDSGDDNGEPASSGGAVATPLIAEPLASSAVSTGSMARKERSSRGRKNAFPNDSKVGPALALLSPSKWTEDAPALAAIPGATAANSSSDSGPQEGASKDLVATLNSPTEKTGTRGPLVHAGSVQGAGRSPTQLCGSLKKSSRTPSRSPIQHIKTAPTQVAFTLPTQADTPKSVTSATQPHSAIPTPIVNTTQPYSQSASSPLLSPDGAAAPTEIGVRTFPTPLVKDTPYSLPQVGQYDEGTATVTLKVLYVPHLKEKKHTHTH